MTVFIRFSGSTMSVDVPSDATVGDLIAAATDAGLPRSATLSYAASGQALDDVHSQLCDLGIGAEAWFTGLPPVIFEGMQIDHFDIEGRFATLHDDITSAGICLAHKTRIGQMSRMQIKILNLSEFCSAIIWAKDSLCTNAKVLEVFLAFGSVHVNGEVGDVTITVNAKEQNDVDVIYKDTQSECKEYVNLRILSDRFSQRGLIEPYHLTNESQIQICVKLNGYSNCPATIEFVNFEVAGI